MKLVIIVNHETDTFETCLPSRDLSCDELHHIYDLMSHGTQRTVHYAEVGDKPIPFLDIVEILTEVAKEAPPSRSHQPGQATSLSGLPVKHQG